MLGPRGGVICNFRGPIVSSLVDLFNPVYACWLEYMVSLQFWPMDLIWSNLASILTRAYGEPCFGRCMEFPENKMQQSFGGPGIRTQVPMDHALACLPTQPTHSFVIGIPNKYYIQNKLICLAIKKTSAKFKRTNEKKTHFVFFVGKPGFLPADFIRSRIPRFVLKYTLGYRNAIQSHGSLRLSFMIISISIISPNFTCKANA